MLSSFNLHNIPLHIYYYPVILTTSGAEKLTSPDYKLAEAGFHPRPSNTRAYSLLHTKLLGPNFLIPLIGDDSTHPHELRGGIETK